MLPFRKITLADKAAIEQIVRSSTTYLCEHCFVDLFIWNDHYHTEICIQDAFLFVRCTSATDEKPCYLAPIGQGDLRAAVQAIRQDAHEREIPFQMISVPEELLPEFEAAVGDIFTFQWSEDSADYIYLSEKLQTLAGKKLQSKRNMVNRFQAAYEGRWRYEAITQENTALAYAYHAKWCRQHGCAKNADFLGETCAVKLALDHFAQLQLCGGMLYLDDEVIAYTLGCQAREDLFIVQIEKANPEIDGAYQMINQQFVRANCTDVQFVNREEDLGLEGLRKAKQSYRPERMGKKFYAIAKDSEE